MAQETGVLLQWLKAEGDEVTQGEPLMEIETDKAAVEVEAQSSGVLANVTAAPGDEVPVGQVIALILAPGETAPETRSGSVEDTVSVPPVPDGSRPEKRLASPVAVRIADEHDVDLSEVDARGSRIQKEDVLAHISARAAGQSSGGYRLSPASPKARQLAAEYQLDISTIDGSGPAGAVLVADVSAAVEAQKTGPAADVPSAVEPAGEALPVSRMWQVMAQRLTQSWTTVPHFYLVREARARDLVEWRARAQKRLPEKITFTDLLVKLVAIALQRHPRLNARWQDGMIVPNEEINLGLAVAVDDGLLVPVIRQADRLGLSEIAERRKVLVANAQAGKLSPAEMGNSTFTLSNLGMFGIDAFNAIVNPPEAAILALGRIADRVIPVDGQPVVEPALTLTLSCDHRVVDGARGARFLQTLVNFIEDPLAALD
jgi:pyruvate dehydrogenase E2 component (dihydrolipoamide acetyltransferase)